MNEMTSQRAGRLVVLLLFAAVTTASAQENNEIRCRGGGSGFGLDTIGRRIASSGETILTMSLRFFNTSEWVPVEHISDSLITGGYQRLTPRSCAKVADGDGKSLEPIYRIKAIRFETSANAQLKQRLHGSEVDTSPTAAERYPDAGSIREYLRDPNHYWSFFIVGAELSGTPFFITSGNGFYEPPRVTLSPNDFKALKRSPVVTPGDATESTTQAGLATSDRQNAPTGQDQLAKKTGAGLSEPVRAKNLLRLPPQATARKPLTKCEAAKLARARNSPAAPGLEASCLEEQKLATPNKSER